MSKYVKEKNWCDYIPSQFFERWKIRESRGSTTPWEATGEQSYLAADKINMSLIETTVWFTIVKLQDDDP